MSKGPQVNPAWFGYEPKEPAGLGDGKEVFKVWLG